MTELLTTFTTTIVLDRYEDIREALFDPTCRAPSTGARTRTATSATASCRSATAPVHRARRRVENTQFRPERPAPVRAGALPDGPERPARRRRRSAVGRPVRGRRGAVGGRSPRCAPGIDVDDHDLGQLTELVRYVDVFSQGSAILDARDPEAVRTMVVDAYAAFERDWVRPSWEPPGDPARGATGGARSRTTPCPTTSCRCSSSTATTRPSSWPTPGRVVREVATYLQGGTHTSAQTMANAFDLLFEDEAAMPGLVDALRDGPGRSASACVHETLRLRPTTPKIRRRAEADTVVAGRPVPSGQPGHPGCRGRQPRSAPVRAATRTAFDPDRTVDPSVPRWGLSFGAGAHQCPGRSVGGGFPVPAHGAGRRRRAHLRPGRAGGPRGRPAGHPAGPGARPERDTRTERFTRWASYPVLFERWGSARLTVASTQPADVAPADGTRQATAAGRAPREGRRPRGRTPRVTAPEAGRDRLDQVLALGRLDDPPATHEGIQPGRPQIDRVGARPTGGRSPGRGRRRRSRDRRRGRPGRPRRPPSSGRSARVRMSALMSPAMALRASARGQRLAGVEPREQLVDVGLGWRRG